MLTDRSTRAVGQPTLAMAALATSALVAACSSEPFYGSAVAGAGGSGGSESGYGGATNTASVVAVSATSATTAATSSTGVLTSSCVVQVVDWYDVVVADAVVAVHDATGEPLYTTKTDTAGQAAVEVPMDGSISVYTSSYSPYEYHSVQTYETPPDGSLIHVVALGGSSPVAGIATTYKVVAQGFPVGTTTFDFQGHCSSQSTAASSVILTNANCTTLPTEEFLVTAKDQNGALLAWGQAGAFTSPGTTLDLAVIVSNASTHTMTGTLTDLPATTSSAGLDIRGIVQPYDVFHDAVAGAYPDFSMTGSVAALPIERYFGVFARPESTAQYRTYFSSSERNTALPNMYLASLNDIANITASSLDTSDPTRPRIAWATDGGPTPELGFIFLFWTFGTVTFSWAAAFPGTHPTNITFPRPPVEVQGFAPTGLVVLGDTDVSVYRGMDYASWLAGSGVAVGARVTMFGRNLYASP